MVCGLVFYLFPLKISSNKICPLYVVLRNCIKIPLHIFICINKPSSFRFQAVDLEFELRKGQLEETTELGAALSNDASESSKFAIDDKIIKLKEHWEAVTFKFRSHRQQSLELIEHWGTYEDLRGQLVQWLQSAEKYFSGDGAKDPGSTVTELEEQLMQHKVQIFSFVPNLVVS